VGSLEAVTREVAARTPQRDDRPQRGAHGVGAEQPQGAAGTGERMSHVANVVVGFSPRA
jgi:hypothetical protein